MSRKPAVSKPKSRRTTERLPVELTSDERTRASLDAADLMQERDRIAEALKEHTKTKREKLSGLDRKLREMLDAVRTGFRLANVECEERETETGIRVFRLDTGEEIRPEPGTQRELFVGSSRPRDESDR